MAATARFHQFTLDTETLGAGWKLYHYLPGTTDLKDVWQDRDKGSTAAQPIVADANGVISGFFDGLYDLAVYNANDVLKYTWSDVYIADAPTVGSEGSGLNAASTLNLSGNVSEIYFHVAGTTTITGISGSQSFVILTFDSTPSLTHGASFVLRDATSRLMRAGETVMFVNDGSNVWHEVTTSNRLRNDFFLNSTDQPGTAEIGVIKLNDDDDIELGVVPVYLSGGNLRFPSSQNQSADTNTLDDYVEDDWTPALTFETPGDLSVAYTTQLGRYIKIGKTVRLSFKILTSTFTHTTASGVLKITGLPTLMNTTVSNIGALAFNGITKANYTQFSLDSSGNDYLVILASAQGQSISSVGAGDVPTGGTVELRGTIVYEAAQ